ncbi:MAG: hypothetical protein HW387_261 [Parachlamydiales bacterium]|nr:hypothetical protein [Parachlamydiales bacterium]
MGGTISQIHSKSVRSSIMRKLFVHSWWAVVFSTLCIAFYFQAAHSRSTVLFDLSSRMQDMEQEKLIVAQEQDELNLRLQSESDPAWIEMTLMKELGVVPEGWTKVHFQK